MSAVVQHNSRQDPSIMLLSTICWLSYSFATWPKQITPYVTASKAFGVNAVDRLMKMNKGSGTQSSITAERHTENVPVSIVRLR